MQVQRPSKGEQTRHRIMDLAEQEILHKGFAATSIDGLIAAAGITKSGFFYHFRDKNELARSLLERYLARDEIIFNDLFAKADALHEDPLHAFLIFLKLLAELMADLPNGHPGCIVASYTYQDQLFSRDVREMTAQGVHIWRARFRKRLDLIAAKYPPKVDVDLDVLADMVAVVIDGGIVLSKNLGEPRHLPAQILQFRNYIRLLFVGP